MKIYYNEFDPKAAAWLRELISRNLIAPGVVDEQSITEVDPDDLLGFTQCHFFAGIGGWSYALRLAGWPDDRPVWTGSCPCQPFSSAGRGLGTADERHLWPQFARLIGHCKPPVVFGEQVASKAGRDWLSGVRSDLEGLAYAVGAADLCAAGLNSPHIRQRLFWVGGRVAEDPAGIGRGGRGDADPSGDNRQVQTAGLGDDGNADCRVSDCSNPRLEGHPRHGDIIDQRGRVSPEPDRPASQGGGTGAVDWTNAVLWPCRDGKYRRVPAVVGVNGEAEVEPGLFPLADGVPERVGLLRGSGNAIVPQVAAAFIEAYCETLT